MLSWETFLDKKFTLRTQNYFYTLPFFVEKACGKVSVRIHNFTLDDSIESFRQDFLFRKYCDHPAVDSSKQVLLRPSFPDIIETIFQQSIYLHLYDPQEQLWGRWKPGNCELVFTSKKANQPLPVGRWSMVVVSTALPEVNVRFHFQVEAFPLCEESVVTPLHPFSSSNPEEKQEERWYIGELHEHPSQTKTHDDIHLIQRYEKLGFQFLAYSEHDQGIALNEDSASKICLLPSQEIRTPNGHAMLFGLSEFLRWYEEGKCLSLREIISETHSRRGLFCLLHPFSVHLDPSGPRWKEDEEWLHIDLLEIWSGAWSQRFPEILKTFDLWDELLNRGLRIYGTSGKGSSVAMNDHTVDQLPKTVVFSEGANETDLLSALKQGRFYSTREPAINVWVESEYGGAMLGDELRLPVRAPFLIRIQISRMDRGYMRIFTNEGIYCEMPISSTKDFDQKFIETSKQETRWFRLEIYQYSRPIDELIAFTNPIFVRGISSIS